MLETCLFRVSVNILDCKVNQTSLKDAKPLKGFVELSLDDIKQLQSITK